MTLKNVLLALRDQLPFWRFLRNFFWTGNAWGMFSKNAHTSQSTGKTKVVYGSRETAVKAAVAMMRKHPTVNFSPYKCVHCDGYHIGRNNK